MGMVSVSGSQYFFSSAMAISFLKKLPGKVKGNLAECPTLSE
jgi:hypothetical protein